MNMPMEEDKRITTAQVTQEGENTEDRNGPTEKGVRRWRVDERRKVEILQWEHSNQTAQ